MRKVLRIAFSLFLLIGLVESSYATDAERSTLETTTSAVARAVNPWAGIAFLETERNAIGTPQKGFANLMFVEVGRSILADVVPGLSVAGRLYGANKFTTDEPKEGLSRHYEVYEPTLLLKKGNLFQVAGVTASAQTRFYAPLNPDARIAKRNPHSGNWRQVVALEMPVGKWTVASSVFGQYYNFERNHNDLTRAEDNPDGAPNDRLRLFNDASVSYQVASNVALRSLLELDSRWKRVTGQTWSLMEWINTVEVSPVTNLTLEAGVVMAAPNQSLFKYFENNDTRLNNTRARLDLTYKFL